MLHRTDTYARKSHALLALTSLAILLPTASCVPGGVTTSARPQALAPAPVLSVPTAAAIASFTAPAPTPDEVAAAVAGAPVAVPSGAAPTINAAIPFTAGPNPAAPALLLRLSTATDRVRSLQCLTEAIYYEAASESDQGQRAVAQVVLNRMRHPAYPASVCGVVYQNAHRWLACQFSFACDGARARAPSAAGWARARRHASEALAGRVEPSVGLATHYHTWNVVPFWAHKLAKTAVVGAHIFYRLNGGLGQLPAFRQRHAGYEPAPAPLTLPPATALAAASIAEPLTTDLAAVVPPEPLIAPVNPRKIAVPETLTAPEPPPSPIMQAVEGSTVREEYRNSGAVRPEFAGR